MLSTAALFGIAASPVAATIPLGDPALLAYLAGRLAEADGQPDAALAGYVKALSIDASNSLIAGKTYRLAVENGDFALALQATRTLTLQEAIEPEMPLFAFADGFSARQWAAAANAAQLLADQGNFAFLQPLLQIWVAHRQGQPTDPWVKQAEADTVAKFYVDDQRLFLALIDGPAESAWREVQPLAKSGEARLSPLRILLARHFLALGQSERAAILVASESTAPEARLAALITAGKGKRAAQRLDPSLALGYLFKRIGDDLTAQRASFLAQVSVMIAVHLAPQWDLAKVSLGQSLADLGHHDQAIATLARFDASSPYWLVAENLKANSHIAQKAYAVADTDLSKLIRRNRDSAELHALHGQVRQAAEDWAGAADSFAKAVAVSEAAQADSAQMANYLLLLGSAQERAGQWEAAKQSLERANRLFPNSAIILNFLGYAQLERRENVVEALAHIRAAYKLQSNSAAITDSLGWGLFLTGAHAEAVPLLEKAQLGQPDDPTINEHLGDAYWQIGRAYEARYAWRSARLFAEADSHARLDAKIDIGLTEATISP